MKTIYLFLSFMIVVLSCSMMFLSGCGSFWNGAGVGVVGAGAAYEVNAKTQLDQLDRDYKDGKINKEEYEARRDQIKKGSLVY